MCLKRYLFYKTLKKIFDSQKLFFKTIFKTIIKLSLGLLKIFFYYLKKKIGKLV